MSSLFMLHNEKYIFSTYIDNKTIVFACNSYDTVQRLRNSVTHIRMSRGRWLNNAKEYKSRKDNATIQLTEASRSFSSSFNSLSIAELNLHESLDLKFIDMIYQLNNIEIFITHDFDIKWEKTSDTIVPLLSIQGVLLSKPCTEMFDVIEYLNALHPLDCND